MCEQTILVHDPGVRAETDVEYGANECKRGGNVGGLKKHLLCRVIILRGMCAFDGEIIDHHADEKD